MNDFWNLASWVSCLCGRASVRCLAGRSVLHGHEVIVSQFNN